MWATLRGRIIAHSTWPGRQTRFEPFPSIIYLRTHDMVAGDFLLLGLVQTWLTPIWLLCLGIATGMVGLVAIYAVVRIASARAGRYLAETVREGILWPISGVAALLTAFALFLGLLGISGSAPVPVGSLLSSLGRIGQVGERTETITIPPATKDLKVPVKFRAAEIQAIRLSADAEVRLITHLVNATGREGEVRLDPTRNTVFRWDRVMIQDKPFSEFVDSWSATNLSFKPATLTIYTFTDIEFPKVRAVFYTAAAVAGFFGLYLLVNLLAPKISAIALTTAKESMGQPIYGLMLGLGAFLLLAFVFIPYNTFGEDLKVVKDEGLTLIMIFSIIVAVWSASTSVADEIEGKTALTVLSKPIRRHQFILGKYLGILWPVALMFVLLGIVFMFTVSYKLVYDVRETAQTEPSWQIPFVEMILTLPGLLLAFMETMVMAAISVAISTRLPMLPNLVICAAIYALGNLAPLLLQSAVGKFEIVRFMAQLITTFLPVLDHFNLHPAIAAGKEVPLAYLGWTLLYALVYSAVAMVVALLLFDNRDLA